MLSYFPTPYPNEWWYSVLCRYHVRSGYQKHQTTMKELFGGDISISLAGVFPNNTIRKTLAQLPMNLLSFDDVVCRHTLFPFYMRFYPVREKHHVLGRLRRGENVVVTGIRKYADVPNWHPRYCPQCVENDRQQYGEPYWHIDHQIPLMTVCPIHSCRIISFTSLSLREMGHSFIPLTKLALQNEKTVEFAPWEEKLSQILCDYFNLPLSIGMTDGYNNIAITLANMGYESIQNSSPHTVLQTKKLYRDLQSYFGNETVERIIGTERNANVINRLGKWTMKTPERYALLQCFAGLESKDVFGDILPSQREIALRELSCNGQTYTKKQIMAQLQVTSCQLDTLLRKYQLRPFWRGADRQEKTHRLQFQLSESEYAAYKQALAASGMRYDSDFIRLCVLTAVKNNST